MHFGRGILLHVLYVYLRAVDWLLLKMVLQLGWQLAVAMKGLGGGKCSRLGPEDRMNRQGLVSPHWLFFLQISFEWQLSWFMRARRYDLTGEKWERVQIVVLVIELLNNLRLVLLSLNVVACMPRHGLCLGSFSSDQVVITLLDLLIFYAIHHDLFLYPLNGLVVQHRLVQDGFSHRVSWLL